MKALTRVGTALRCRQVFVQSPDLLRVFIDLVEHNLAPTHFSKEHCAVVIDSVSVRVLSVVRDANADCQVPRGAPHDNLMWLQLKPCTMKPLQPRCDCLFTVELTGPIANAACVRSLL